MRAVEPQDPALTFAGVLDALPIVAFIARPDGTISYLSRGWDEFGGVDTSEILGDAYESLIHSEHRTDAAPIWRAALATETPYRDEIRLKYADGTYRWVVSQALPMREPTSSRVIGWFGTLTDINDRIRAQETFRAQAEFNERLIESSDDCIKILDLEARLVSLSLNGQRALHITNMDALVGTSWIHFWHGADQLAARTAVDTALAGGTGKFIAYFPVQDEPRWFDVVVTAIMRRDGAPEKLLVVSRDVTVQRLADDAREMFVALIENSSDFIGIRDSEGTIAYVNEAGRQLLEIESLEEAKATPLLDYFCPADREYLRTEILPALERNGRWVGDFAFRNFRTGIPIPVAYQVFRLVDRTGSVTGVATVSRDRRRQLRVEAGLRLLSRTSVATLDSLNSVVTLPNVAQAFVPEYASYCIIDVIPPGKQWRRTVVHRDPNKEQFIRNLSEPGRNHPVTLALVHGRSSLVVVDENFVEAVGGQADRIQAAHALEVRSFITVPVIMPNGEIIGGLTCARDAADDALGVYNSDDLGFVQEAGRRAGAAIANARLYERERRIAVELQAASLPASLPRVEGLLLNAEYRPGSDEATIGGDWYDAFVLKDGRVAITVGDVIGHGLHAAVTMTKLRQAMQAAAMVEPDPNVMLRVADETLRLLDVDGYATAVAALYDRERQTLTFASAGHPGPVVRDPEGHVRDYASPGLMLGLRSGDETAVTVIPMPQKSTVVFYTDGLVEATRDFEGSASRLRAAISRPDIVFHPQSARAIVDSVLGPTSASDDIAVLVAHIAPRT